MNNKAYYFSTKEEVVKGFFEGDRWVAFKVEGAAEPQHVQLPYIENMEFGTEPGEFLIKINQGKEISVRIIR